MVGLKIMMVYGCPYVSRTYQVWKKHVAGRRTDISGKRLKCDNNITERGENIPFQFFLLLFWPSSRYHEKKIPITETVSGARRERKNPKQWNWTNLKDKIIKITTLIMLYALTIHTTHQNVSIQQYPDPSIQLHKASYASG